MSNTTFAQLPGLQKAGKILELQEQINQHHLFATWLLEIFNDLHFLASHTQNAVAQKQAEHIQVVCEWHGTQAMMLQVQLNSLQCPS